MTDALVHPLEPATPSACVAELSATLDALVRRSDLLAHVLAERDLAAPGTSGAAAADLCTVRDLLTSAHRESCRAVALLVQGGGGA